MSNADKEDMNKRLKRLSLEYGYCDKFDYIIINDDLKETIKKIEEIVIKRKA